METNSGRERRACTESRRAVSRSAWPGLFANGWAVVRLQVSLSQLSTVSMICVMAYGFNYWVWSPPPPLPTPPLPSPLGLATRHHLEPARRPSLLGQARKRLTRMACKLPGDARCSRRRPCLAVHYLSVRTCSVLMTTSAGRASSISTVPVRSSSLLGFPHQPPPLWHAGSPRVARCRARWVAGSLGFMLWSRRTRPYCCLPTWEDF